MSRQYKTKKDEPLKTKKNILDNWKKYYNGNLEYHLTRNRKYYLERISKWYDWFEEIGYLKCSKCGYNEHPKALDFHHVNKDEKLFGIGKFINGRQCTTENKELVLEEISKCIVLCANCHRIHHFLNRN